MIGRISRSLLAISLFFPSLISMNDALLAAVQERMGGRPALKAIHDLAFANNFEAVFATLANEDIATQKMILTTEIYKLLVPENQWDTFEINEPNLKAFFTIAHWAAANNNVAALRQLQELSIDFNLGTRVKVLHVASFNGSLEVMRYLHSLGTNLEQACSVGQTALHYAAIAGNIPAIECLHKLGVNLEARSHCALTPLLLAIIRGNLAVAQYLLQLGATIPAQAEGKTALHLMIYSNLSDSNPEDMIRWLHNNSIPLEAKDQGGSTALHLAADRSQSKKVAILCNLGALVNATNNNGDAPLHLCASQDNAHCTETIRILVSHGASITARNNHRQMPLHIAAIFRNIPAILCLYKLGAPLEALNKKGLTPFEHALSGPFHQSLVYLPVAATLYTLGAKCRILSKFNWSMAFSVRRLPDEATEVLKFMKLIEDIEKFKQQRIIQDLQDEFFLLRFFGMPKEKIEALELFMSAVELKLNPLVEHLLPFCPGKTINNRRDGLTLLHRAAMACDPKIIRTLFKHPDLDYSLKDNESRTLLECVEAASSGPGKSQIPHEIERGIKIRLFLWLCKSQVINEQGNPLILPRDVCLLIARLFKL